MKNFVKGVIVMAIAMTAMSVQAQEKVLTVDQLPQTAQQFIKQHYDVKSVSHVIMEDEFFSSKEFKVALVDGTELEFDSKGQWTEVDPEKGTVPEAIIPGNIRSYISKSFPNNKVEQISRSSRKYEVELTSGLDLEFDRNGKFLRIDD